MTEQIKKTEKKGLDISAKSFLAAIAVILVLMVLTYALTLLIPAGEYTRIPDENGKLIIDPENGFHRTDGGIPFLKWLLSPLLVLTAEGSGTIIAVIIFLLVLGGIFNALEKCGLLQYLLNRVTLKFRDRRYAFLAIVVFLFMTLGSLVGSYEECVPMVPLAVAIAIGFGWDALTGIGMCLLAAGCGFAAGVCNPFTVGVAQDLAGLPMFSGIWLRALSFAAIYGLLLLFLLFHAKKIERPADSSAADAPFHTDRRMDRGLIAFATILGSGLLIVLSSAFFTFLQDYTMIIVAVMFLAAGVFSVKLAGMENKRLLKTFWDGLASIFPAVFMILMASSIKYTLTEAKILDTLLHAAVDVAGHLPKAAVVLFLYLLVLVMNFFIPSGSAKAFLLIPLIVPIAQMFGISSQLCIMAYAFGDGFSNAFYPTNPVLLISLGLSGIDYGKWAKWSGKFQILNIILTSGLLLLGLAVGY